MEIDDQHKLKYPIGYFKEPEEYSESNIEEWILVLEDFPCKLENLVKNLTDAQLDTPYRINGWTIRQVIHHLADSHHHSYIRFKWGLTEDKPTIKYYFEKLWAELPDAKHAPIDLSLNHIKAVHAKLVFLLKSLSIEDLHKSFIHPEYNKEVVLWKNIGIYAWHSNHHYAHVENLMKSKRW